jgi:hypothetical protein
VKCGDNDIAVRIEDGSAGRYPHPRDKELVLGSTRRHDDVEWISDRRDRYDRRHHPVWKESPGSNPVARSDDHEESTRRVRDRENFVRRFGDHGERLEQDELPCVEQHRRLRSARYTDVPRRKHGASADRFVSSHTHYTIRVLRSARSRNAGRLRTVRHRRS